MLIQLSITNDKLTDIINSVYLLQFKAQYYRKAKSSNNNSIEKNTVTRSSNIWINMSFTRGKLACRKVARTQ